MRHLIALRPLALVALLILVFAKNAHAAGCDPGSGRKSPSRFPVVFKPNEKLFGSRVSNLRAWRFIGKKWEQTALQVDEVGSDGSYVLEEGLPYTKFNDDGLLDANDELSIAGKSLGENFIGLNLDKNLRAHLNRWAKVDFCAGDSTYLGSILIAEDKQQLADLPFKPLFNRKESEVLTSKYHYKFRANQPMLIGEVKVVTPRGEKDVFAGSSFVMPLIPRLFFFPDFYFGEDDFTSEIESWRSGPVRSIVAVGSKMKKFFSLIDLHLFSELVFYDDFFQIPTQIEFVFDPSRFLTRGSGLAYILKYPEGVDWTLTSNLESLPPGGPESGSIKKTAYEQSSQGVFGVRGSSSIGSFIANVRVDEKALRQAPPPYIASKQLFMSEGVKKAWPWLARADGSLGVFIEISGVKAGGYDFALDVALSNQADDVFADFQTVWANWPDLAEH